jgi:hypothetical protein
MSIIQEALKKVRGVPEDKKTDSVDTYRYETSGYGYREKRSSRSFLFLVIIFLAASSFYFFRNVFPDVKSAATQPVTAVHEAAAPAALQTEEQVPAPLQIQAGGPVVKTPDPVFILSGIMFLEDGPRAIINGSVVEKGDVVGGASVESVERERVLLRYKDENITLHLK